jgi:hypothetical protein
MPSDNRPSTVQIMLMGFTTGVILTTAINVHESMERIKAMEAADQAYHAQITRELTEVKRMLAPTTPERPDHASQ